MEKLAFIYLEGNDGKVTVFEKDKDKLKLIKAESLSAAPALAEKQGLPDALDNFEQAEMVGYESIPEEPSLNNSFAQSLNKALNEIDLKTIKFIPILTEPDVHYKKLDDEKELSDLKASFGGKGKMETFGVAEIAEDSKLAVYTSGKSSYLQVLSLLAKMNSLRHVKIVSVKSAEVSLAHYVAGKQNLKEEEVSLIIYIGKEYSKLIFMKGRKILFLGATVPAGRNSPNSYYVIMSKILLEMENASIHDLKRIIICGEDSSGDLKAELNNSYPETEISGLEITEFNLPESGNPISSFSVNLAVAEEYLKEEEKLVSGINLLPAYIAEEQKSFGWESYVLFALVFLAVFAFTLLIMAENSRMKTLDKEIIRYQKLQIANQELTEKLNEKKVKISNIHKTRSVLEHYSQNLDALSSALKKISDYVFIEGDIWFTGLRMDLNRNLELTGYALDRRLLTRLSYTYQDALLSNITYEPIRNVKAYKFNISTNALNKVNNIVPGEQGGAQ